MILASVLARKRVDHDGLDANRNRRRREHAVKDSNGSFRGEARVPIDAESIQTTTVGRAGRTLRVELERDERGHVLGLLQRTDSPRARDAPPWTVRAHACCWRWRGVRGRKRAGRRRSAPARSQSCTLAQPLRDRA